MSKIKIHVRRSQLGVIRQIAIFWLNLPKSECNRPCQDYYGQVKESLHIFTGAIKSAWQMLAAKSETPVCIYFSV